MDKDIVAAFDVANQHKRQKSFPRLFSAEPGRGVYRPTWDSPVMKASGMLAASTHDNCGGLRRICVSSTAANSA
jgi:hypothetical protein